MSKSIYGLWDEPGVSTYIAALFMLLIFAAFLASVFLVISNWTNVVTEAITKERFTVEESKELLILERASTGNGYVELKVRNTGDLNVYVTY